MAICSYCGANNKDDSLFCTRCGAELRSNNQAQQTSLKIGSYNQPPAPMPSATQNTWFRQHKANEYAPNMVKKKVNKKTWIAAGSALLLIVVGVIAVLLSKSDIFAAKKETNVSISAKFDTDGSAYVPLMNGEVVELGEGIRTAKVFPNRKYIAVLTEDDELYYTNTSLKGKTVISSDCASLECVWDEGFIYIDNDDNYHRYLYSKGTDTEIGEIESIELSDSNFNISYVQEDSVYLLSASSEDGEKIGKIENYCEILSVSDDGKTVFWTDYAEGEEEIYCYTKKEKSKIAVFETDDDEPHSYVIYNKGQDYAVVLNSYAEQLYVVTDKDEPLKVKLSGEPDTSVFTENGSLKDETSRSYKGCYVCTEGSDGGYNLYYIDKNGDREKVVSDVDNYTIYDGQLYYMDTDGNLKTGKLKGADISDEEKIAGDIDILCYKCINGYLYYMKNVDDDSSTGTLYAYKRGEEPVKVSSNVGCLVFDFMGYYTFRAMYYELSSDGKTIYYYKDMEDSGDSTPYYGNLYKFTYGKSDSEKIASVVVAGFPDSGYDSGLLNNDSFTYFKYDSVNDDDNIVGKWCYFDGDKETVMAQNIIN